MIEEEVEDLEELGEDEPEQEQEMYEHFRLEVDPGQNLLRIDRFPGRSVTQRIPYKNTGSCRGPMCTGQ